MHGSPYFTLKITQSHKMKKFTTLLLLVTIFLLPTVANERSEIQMEQIAIQKLYSARMAKSYSNSQASMNIKCVIDNSAYKVFNADNGFVIVSKDDKIAPVLGYSTSGNIDKNNLPCGLKWWLDKVSEKTNIINSYSTSQYNNNKTLKANFSTVEPLITTKWDQGEPFNRKCPKINNASTYAGCVAISLAQVLNFNKYPVSASFTSSYYVNSKRVDNESTETTYLWPYSNTYSSSSLLGGNRVAMLIRDCGYAVHMNYTTESSGASPIYIPSALIDDFAYPEKAVKIYFRDYYSDNEWEGLVYNEIMRGYPLIYNGSDAKNGGHSFVAAGIDDNGLIYIEWGWGGHADGYFDMNVLNTDGMQFSTAQSIVTGVRQKALDTDNYQSLLTTDSIYSFKYFNDNDSLAITFNKDVYNMTPTTLKGRFCLVLDDITENKTYYEDLMQENDTVASFYGFAALSFGSVMTFDKSHSYHIYMATKDNRESEWQPLRTFGGPIYYDITVDADGLVTINDKPIYTDIKQINYISTAKSAQADNRIYSIDGKYMGKDTNKLTRGIYILNGKKIIK